MECKVNGNTIEVANAKLIFRNFSGEPSVYNNRGDRNFCLVLPDDKAVEFFKSNGYSPTVKPSTSEPGEFFRYLKVKLKFNSFGPTIILVTGDSKRRVVTEDIVGSLDNIRISSVDLDIRPYDWERPDGKSGRTAYLAGMCVYQQVDRFEQMMLDANKYADSEDVPF